MFENENIRGVFEGSESVNIKGLVLAEWNFNNSENLFKIGNYRHRPLESSSKYKNIINFYDPNDNGNFYTDATNADIVIDGGYDDSDEPQLFTSIKEKEGQLFSLEDCFNKFRPRSGINIFTIQIPTWLTDQDIICQIKETILNIGVLIEQKIILKEELLRTYQTTKTI